MTQHAHVHGESSDFLVNCFQRVRLVLSAMCRCRECGDQCSFTTSVCQTCGMQDPVQVPVSWGIAFLGVCTTILATGVWAVM